MPDRIARTVIGLFTLTTLVFWLPAVRGAFDGPSYQWGLFGLGGRGVGGDYWFPVVGASGALAVLAGAWRCRRWAFVVLAAWSVVVFVAVLAAVTSNPAGFRFRGDTLGIISPFCCPCLWTDTIMSGVSEMLRFLAHSLSFTRLE
jgi:hypothetical protein